MVCAEDFFVKEKVLKALYKCKKYYMEVDLASALELGEMENITEKRIDFGQGLSEKEKEELNRILLGQFNMTIEEANQLPPMVLINKMTTDAIECEDFLVVEIELLKLAQEAELQPGGLETGLQQLKIAEKVFDAKEVLYQLKSAGDYKDLFKKMLDTYRTENLFELAEFVTDKRFMSRSAYKILVDNRNKRWIKKIPELIMDESVFIAVGAGHLPGERGIIELLRKDGYAVNPVYR